MRRLLLPLLILAVFMQTANAQIQVGLTLKRQFFIAYEPIIATVTITNLAGQDLPLADAQGRPWFGLNISRADGMPVPPHDTAYKLSPLTIPAGATVKRSVNLNTLYPVHDYGPYKVQAVIYFALADKYFESRTANIEISEGKTVWQQVVGVPSGQPDAGSSRKISLLTFRQPTTSMLYARVADLDTGTVYCTTQLGRVLDNMEPEIRMDSFNRLHVLQSIAAKTYLHSEVGPNGVLLALQTYISESKRPALVKDSSGEVVVKGGVLQVPNRKPGAITAFGKEVPKLSDHPVELPKD